MPRILYSALFYLLLPCFFLRLVLRGLRVPAQMERWPQRFGFVPWLDRHQPTLWVHSVSVGETVAIAPLLNAFMQARPDCRIVVTNTTLTGAQQAKKIYGNKVIQLYAPYDLPGSVARFVQRVQPTLAVMVETELWPNMLASCRAGAIPVFVANARLSDRSARGYRRIGALATTMLDCLSQVAAQTDADARRFIALGLDPARVTVTGTLKYDIELHHSDWQQGQARRQHYLAGRPAPAHILIAASTHRGEDEQVLAAFASLRKSFPETLLILAPRHPERFQPVAELVEKRGFCMARLSESEPLRRTTEVLLADTMGELMALFASADIAFVGGSLIESGGHNPLEPAVCGLPVLMGPHVFNFAQVVQTLTAAGALQTVHNSAELATCAQKLLACQRTRQRRGEAARAVVNSNRGALQRQLDLLTDLLPGPVPLGTCSTVPDVLATKNV